MKDHAKNKKLKRARSSSSSSHFTISDDDSPKVEIKRNHVRTEEKPHHKKHHKHSHKHNRYHNDDDSVDCDDRSRHKARVKEHKHKESFKVTIKEEPPSEDERRKKYKDKPSDSSRHITSRGNGSGERRQLFNEESSSNTVEPEWGNKQIKTEKKEPVKNNAKPDFGLSGKLTEDANTFNGVVIKYSEPPEARKPKRRWRLYPFKGENSLPILHIHRQSAYLLGRDRKVADIPIDHPSCSKQHAALQYRLVPFTRSDGSSGKQIRLYVIDLESANGTYLNNQKIEPKKYYELKERDVVKFGYSSREYVLLHEHSKDSEEDDNVNNED